ncbi:MAG: homoserine kinase, partial [Roseiarcus sp.]
YTEVSDGDLLAFLETYDLGRVRSLKGIAEGVENSNYLLQTEAGSFILTLYEKRVEEENLPFFLGLMEHLSAKGVTCPQPVKARSGAALGRLSGRPAAIVTFLQGVCRNRPGARDCAKVGEALAQLHQAAADFKSSRANSLNLEAWPRLFAPVSFCADDVAPGLSAEIAAELGFLKANWPGDLPRGVIHADLFPDNVLFLGAEVSGLIDFYFACTDDLAYDLAICLNAWCFEQHGAFNTEKAVALFSAYRSIRPLTAAEVEAMPALARGAALRFALTRLIDWLHVPPGALVSPKDPLEYMRKLRFHQTIGGASELGLAP